MFSVENMALLATEVLGCQVEANIGKAILIFFYFLAYAW